MQQAPATTPRQRELWRKAISSPDLLTADERQEILNTQDVTTKNINILKISGLTPEEFIAKAKCGLTFLTDAESPLIQRNFYIRTRARGCGYWLDAPRIVARGSPSMGDALRAIHEPRMTEIFRAVCIDADEKRKSIRVDPAGFKNSAEIGPKSQRS